VLAVGSTSEGLVPRAEVGTLNVSRVVKGCWQLSGGHRGDRDSDRTVGKSAVDDFDAFVNAGITTFDTADIYGPSEELIGKYLTQRGSAEGVQVFTKLCYFGSDMNMISDKQTDKRLKASRLRLQMDKLDLVQLYWHDYSKRNYVDAMRALYANESVRNIGVTNFDTQRMSEMVDAGVPPVLNQIQYSLLDRRPENGMTDFCAKNNIKLLPYGVVAGGFLSEEYLGKPSSYVNFDTYSKRKYASIISESGGWGWFQSLLGVLDEIAKKHSTTIANIAGKWTLDRPQVVSVLIGARNANHVSDNRTMAQIKLDQADLSAIQKVLDQGNKAKGDCYDWERGGVW
jgi:aryl-alcohol dehydrogenase-like predicted oxidoreductase